MFKTAFALASAAALLACAAPAFAQTPEPTCYQAGNYFVIGQERTDEVGTNFVIRKLKAGSAAPACRYAPAKGDIVLDDPEDPLWYLGTSGHYLVLARSTGPDGDVVIYDMATGNKAVDTPADDNVIVDDAKVNYWVRDFDIKTTAENCPDLAENIANGLGSVIAIETNFDVATGKATRTGAQACSATQ